MWFMIIRTKCFSNINCSNRSNLSQLLLIISISFYALLTPKERLIFSKFKSINTMTKWKFKIKKIPKIPSLNNNKQNNRSPWNYCHHIKSQIHILTFSKIANTILLQALVATILHLWLKIYTFLVKIPYKKLPSVYHLHNFPLITIYAQVFFIQPKSFKPFG